MVNVDLVILAHVLLIKSWNFIIYLGERVMKLQRVLLYTLGLICLSAQADVIGMKDNLGPNALSRQQRTIDSAREVACNLLDESVQDLADQQVQSSSLNQLQILLEHSIQSYENFQKEIEEAFDRLPSNDLNQLNELLFSLRKIHLAFATESSETQDAIRTQYLEHDLFQQLLSNSNLQINGLRPIELKTSEDKRFVVMVMSNDNNSQTFEVQLNVTLNTTRAMGDIYTLEPQIIGFSTHNVPTLPLSNSVKNLIEQPNFISQIEGEHDINLSGIQFLQDHSSEVQRGYYSFTLDELRNIEGASSEIRTALRNSRSRFVYNSRNSTCREFYAQIEFEQANADRLRQRRFIEIDLYNNNRGTSLLAEDFRNGGLRLPEENSVNTLDAN